MYYLFVFSGTLLGCLTLGLGFYRILLMWPQASTAIVFIIIYDNNIPVYTNIDILYGVFWMG